MAGAIAKVNISNHDTVGLLFSETTVLIEAPLGFEGRGGSQLRPDHGSLQRQLSALGTATASSPLGNCFSSRATC